MFIYMITSLVHPYFSFSLAPLHIKEKHMILKIIIGIVVVVGIFDYLLLLGASKCQRERYERSERKERRR